jgi:hypothetical protein
MPSWHNRDRDDNCGVTMKKSPWAIPILLAALVVGCKDDGESAHEWCMVASAIEITDPNQTKEFADRAEDVNDPAISEFGRQLNKFNNNEIDDTLSFITATSKMIEACERQGVTLHQGETE